MDRARSVACSIPRAPLSPPSAGVQVISGVAEILGQPYITGYEPIRSSNGDTIGVFYVGFPLASLSEINEAMNESRILSNGFFALLDHENRILFRTEEVRDPVEMETIVSAAEQHRAIDRRWLVKLRTSFRGTTTLSPRFIYQTSQKKPSPSSGSSTESEA